MKLDKKVSAASLALAITYGSLALASAPAATTAEAAKNDGALTLALQKCSGKCNGKCSTAAPQV